MKYNHIFQWQTGNIRDSDYQFFASSFVENNMNDFHSVVHTLLFIHDASLVLCGCIVHQVDQQ